MRARARDHWWMRLFLLILAVICQTVCASVLTIDWEVVARTSGGAKAPIELRNGDLLAARTESWAKDFLVVCYKSVDGGESWRRLSIIASDDDPFADIGDGHFLVQYVKNGYYFCCKRGVLRLGRS